MIEISLSRRPDESHDDFTERSFSTLQEAAGEPDNLMEFKATEENVLGSRVISLTMTFGP